MFGLDEEKVVPIDSDFAYSGEAENEVVSEPAKTEVCANCDDSGKACSVCHAGDLVE